MAERVTTKHDIQRDELDVVRPNFSDITNIIVSGTLAMSYTGRDIGTGQVVLYSSGTPTLIPPAQIGIYALQESTPLGTGTSINFGNYLAGSIAGTALSLNGNVGTASNQLAAGNRGVLNGTAHAHTVGDGAAITELAMLFSDITTLNSNTGTHGFLPKLSNNPQQAVDGNGNWGSFVPGNGWINGSGTWTCFSTDSPVFNVFINTNMTGTIGLGDRIQGTQSGANKLFIVHGISITGSNTYLNLFGGTDYTLVSGSFTSPQYSQIKAPFGFPVSPTKWSVVATDTGNAAKSSPTANTWYGGTGLSPTGISISAPIGSWRPQIKGLIEISTPATASAFGPRVTFSTANNSESNPEYTWQFVNQQPATAGTFRGTFTPPEYVIELTSKTTLFMNILTGQNSVVSINIRGDVATTTIRLVDTYL